MMFFKDRPIKQKFLLVVMAINITTLLLAFAAFMVYDRWEIRRTMFDQTSTIADILAYNCTAALLFDDGADARETLSFLKTKGSIVSAWIFTPQGTLLAGYVKEGFGPPEMPPLIQKDTAVFKNQELNLTKVVRMENEPVGTIFIQADMGQMTKLIKKHFYIACVGLLFSIILSFLLTVRLQKTISNPIVELASYPGRFQKKKISQ